MTQGKCDAHCIVDFADEGIATVRIANAGTLNILGSPVIDEVTRKYVYRPKVATNLSAVGRAHFFYAR